MSEQSNIPPVIFLQSVFDDFESWEVMDFDNPFNEITWCKDQINDGDLVYRHVSADDKTVFGVLRKMYGEILAKLRAAEKELHELRSEKDSAA